MPEPGNTNAIANFEAFDRITKRADAADDFMPRDNRQFWLGQIAIDDV